jgi:hypothetical protein
MTRDEFFPNGRAIGEYFEDVVIAVHGARISFQIETSSKFQVWWFGLHKQTDAYPPSSREAASKLFVRNEPQYLPDSTPVRTEVRFGGIGAGGPRHREGQQFTLTITNQTRGWSFATRSSVPGALQSSAEWIAEKPNGCPTTSGLCELSDFGIVDFGREFAPVFNAFTNSATVSGMTGPLGSFGTSVQQAVLVNYPSGTTVMAQPFGLHDSGTSFVDAWYSAGP